MVYTPEEVRNLSENDIQLIEKVKGLIDLSLSSYRTTRDDESYVTLIFEEIIPETTAHQMRMLSRRIIPTVLEEYETAGWKIESGAENTSEIELTFSPA